MGTKRLPKRRRTTDAAVKVTKKKGEKDTVQSELERIVYYKELAFDLCQAPNFAWKVLAPFIPFVHEKFDIAGHTIEAFGGISIQNNL